MNLSHDGVINALRASRAGNFQLSEAINVRRRIVPFFRPDQIDAMHKAFEQVRKRMRLTGRHCPLPNLSRFELWSSPVTASSTPTS
jgi:hypothetical protein